MSTPTTATFPGPFETLQNPDVAAAWQKLAPVYDDIATKAAETDATGELNHEAVAQLRDAGYTTLRVPTKYGGAGLTFEQAAWFLVALAEADSNLAQALRAHWLNIEDILSRHVHTQAQQDYRERWLTRIGKEKVIVGNALTERGNVRGKTGTTITFGSDENGDPTAVINGTKYYSTGAAYADWLLVSAVNSEDDTEAYGLNVAVDAPGVTIVDDWDGFGQKLTASGTTFFENTPVDFAELSEPGKGLDSGDRTALGQALAQFVHLATLTGIGRAIVRDSTDYVRTRTRGFSHGAAQVPAEDPQVLQIIGDVASTIYGVTATFGTILSPLSHSLTADSRGKPVPEAQADALYASVYQAQQVIAKNVLRVATEWFEVGGASATSQSRALDRHWRNARVLASHNPLVYRSRIVGDYLVNGTAPSRAYTVGTAAPTENTPQNAQRH